MALWVIGVVLLALIAMCRGSDERTRAEVYCAGSPFAVPGDGPATWVSVYAAEAADVRTGPAPDDSVLHRLVPGGEVHVRIQGEWARIIGPEGELGGWIPLSAVRDAPFTLGELRALPRVHRAALRRQLMEGMDRDSAASVVRLHPRAAPDLQRLYARRDSAGVPLDSAEQAAFLAPFALYADVEEGADAVRLVLVAGMRSARPLTWTRISLVPSPLIPPDTLWPSRVQTPVEVASPGWTPAKQPERIRFVALATDSIDIAGVWGLAARDGVELRMREPECTSAYRVPLADRERLRRSLRLYELSTAERL